MGARLTVHSPQSKGNNLRRRVIRCVCGKFRLQPAFCVWPVRRGCGIKMGADVATTSSLFLTSGCATMAKTLRVQPAENKMNNPVGCIPVHVMFIFRNLNLFRLIEPQNVGSSSVPSPVQAEIRTVCWALENCFRNNFRKRERQRGLFFLGEGTLHLRPAARRMTSLGAIPKCRRKTFAK